MAVTTEIAPNIYRVSIFAQWERDSGHRICNEHRIERSHR
jgi:hypothetical protein